MLNLADHVRFLNCARKNDHQWPMSNGVMPPQVSHVLSLTASVVPHKIDWYRSKEIASVNLLPLSYMRLIHSMWITANGYVSAPAPKAQSESIRIRLSCDLSNVLFTTNGHDNGHGRIIMLKSESQTQALVQSERAMPWSNSEKSAFLQQEASSVLPAH